jgi:hypothetical protein
MLADGASFGSCRGIAVYARSVLIYWGTAVTAPSRRSETDRIGCMKFRFEPLGKDLSASGLVVSQVRPIADRSGGHRFDESTRDCLVQTGPLIFLWPARFSWTLEELDARQKIFGLDTCTHTFATCRGC